MGCTHADWVVHLTTLFFTGLTAESEGEKYSVEKLTTLAAFLATFLGRRRNCALLHPLTTPHLKHSWRSNAAVGAHGIGRRGFNSLQMALSGRSKTV